MLAGVAVPLTLALPAQSARARLPRSPPDAADRRALRPALDDDGLRILSLAALAPSGHNAQPWVVDVVDRGRWRIGTRRERWLPAVDPVNRETVLSVGAFLENLVVAAEQLGFAVDYDVIARASTDPQLLEVRLRKARAVGDGIARIEARRTLRSGHGNEPLRVADIRAITQGPSEVSYFARDTPRARYLAEATVAANRTQAYRDPAQEELATWIRWSKADQARLRDGLTPAGMEIGGLAGWYVGAFYRREDVLKTSFREAGIKQVVERVTQGSGWLVMSGPPTVAGLIETGRRFERMWLGLRERSMAIHPMTQVLEETSDSAAVARELGIDGVPQFVLRIGYVKAYPDPVSPRMPVSWFTCT
jgi:hypothetical protein